MKGVEAPIGQTLLVERGFSRQEIVSRMINRVPSLKIYSSPEQPMDGAGTITHQSLRTPEGIQALNTLIAHHGIDAYWPQDSARFELSDLACEVHSAASPDIITLVDNKTQFTQWLGNDPFRPDATEVTGTENIAKEYDRRQATGQEVCIKPVKGVNGDGYWRLTDNPETSFLKDPDDREIHPEVYLAALAQEEQNRPPQRMLMMEWLPGPEVSVDLLCWRGLSLIHAARTKLGESRQRVQSEHPVIEHAHYIASRLVLHGIVSLQYRLDSAAVWKILEVNPRPAGGSINSEDAGFGIIGNWAALVAGETAPEDILQHNDDVMMAISRVATKSTFTPVV